MIPLYQSRVLMVEQPRQFFNADSYYQVFDERGAPVAHVREDRNVYSFLPGRARQQPHRFVVLSPHGEPMLTLDKPWNRGLPHIYVTAAHGAPVGAIVQDLKFVGSRFTLEDPNGYALGRIEGNWNNWDFRIFDHQGYQVANISKQYTGLFSGRWNTEDRYAVEFGHDVMDPLRTLIVSAAITIDVLLHERDDDFYRGGASGPRGHVGGAPSRVVRHETVVRHEVAESRAARREVRESRREVQEARADAAATRREARAEVRDARREVKEARADAASAQREARQEQRRAETAKESARDARRDAREQRQQTREVKEKSKDAKSSPSRSASGGTSAGKGGSASKGGSSRGSGGSSGSRGSGPRGSSGGSSGGRGGSSGRGSSGGFRRGR